MWSKTRAKVLAVMRQDCTDKYQIWETTAMSNIKLARAKTAITNLKPVTHPSIMVTDCYYERLLLLHTMTARLRLW